LIADFGALPVRERNFAHLMFGDEQARARLAHWPPKAGDLVAFRHVDAGRHPDDPALAELVGELSVRNDLFRGLWAAHPLRDKRALAAGRERLGLMQAAVHGAVVGDDRIACEVVGLDEHRCRMLTGRSVRLSREQGRCRAAIPPTPAIRVALFMTLLNG
jgi:MmyB-like transcription regulator ligand binding domain